MSTTATREEVVEQAARAILKYENWRATDEIARKAPKDRQKGERINRPSFQVADEIAVAFTEDGLEQCRILREAHDRAKELRGL